MHSVQMNESVAKILAWKFPQNAQHDHEEEGLMYACHILQILFAIVALYTSIKMKAPRKFTWAMGSFVLFTWSHAFGHITELWWTYLPVHYFFIISAVLIGFVFDGMTMEFLLPYLVFDYLLIHEVGHVFGVFSAFFIMCYGLRKYQLLSIIMFFGCGLIFSGIVYNDVFNDHMHQYTEMCATVGLGAGGSALLFAVNLLGEENASKRHKLRTGIRAIRPLFS